MGSWRNPHARFLAPMWRGDENDPLQRRWRVPVILAAGVFAGFEALAIHISTVYPYLADNSKACLDCHVLDEGAPIKYAFKAMGGARQAYMLALHMGAESLLGAANYLPSTKISVHVCKQI